MKKQTLKEKIMIAINQVSRESESDTPDFILAEYLMSCLKAFEKAVNKRSAWNGIGKKRHPLSV